MVPLAARVREARETGWAKQKSPGRGDHNRSLITYLCAGWKVEQMGKWTGKV